MSKSAKKSLGGLRAAQRKKRPDEIEIPEEDLRVVLAEGTAHERRFQAAKTTTFEQDLFLMDILEETGIGSLVNEIDLRTMDLNEVGMKIIRQAYRSGQLFLLLGAMLIEDGRAWSEEAAHANSHYFATLSTPGDKEKLYAPVASVVLSFFMSALESSETSRKSSDPSLAVRASKAPRSTSVAVRPSGESEREREPIIEELTTSGSGTEL